jgi:hypothetical protein
MSKGKKKEEKVEEIITPELSPEELERLYFDITEPFPTAIGKAISKKEREETKQFNGRLTYGETDYHSFGTHTHWCYAMI